MSTAYTSSSGGDRLRQLESKIAAARTEVGDDIAGLEVERADDLIGLLPVVAVKAFVGALSKAGAPGDQQRGVTGCEIGAIAHVLATVDEAGMVIFLVLAAMRTVFLIQRVRGRAPLFDADRRHRTAYR